MNRILLYKITTFLYLIVGLLGAFFTIFFIFKWNLILIMICALITYVSFDNVFCKSRKKRYCET